MANYKSLTTENRSSLKRYSHKKRFEIAQEILQIRPSNKILDYGAGDGYMLLRICEGGAEACGFEPDPSLAAEAIARLQGHQEAIHIVHDVQELPDGCFDRICCLEVLEHLPHRILIEALSQMRRLLKPGGFCVVSVPIETGLSGLAKNIVRLLLRQSHQGTTFASLWRIALGRKIERESGVSYISSHLGFDHNELERLLLAQGWKVESRRYSPWPLLKSVLNSQVFFVIKPE
jgi:2-polyprenyl-3-methyl-5-hydroxy-6-metoxy-1,4-benzoquinol methylase